MRRLLIPMSFAADGAGGGIRTPSRGFGNRWFALLTDTRVRNVDPVVFRARLGTTFTPEPTHTIPHMICPVILTVACLPVRIIVPSFWYAVEDSNPYIEIRNLVSYSIERTAHCKLVGELRIELRPRAPEARMQRITPFPDG